MCLKLQNDGDFESDRQRSILASGCVQEKQYQEEQEQPTLHRHCREDDAHCLQQSTPNPLSLLSGHNFPTPLLSSYGSPLSDEVNSSRQCLLTFPRYQVPARS